MTSNPQADPTPNPPDSISFEQLQQLAQSARSASDMMPRGTNMPTMPPPGPDSGLFDLAFAIEQLVICGGGTNLLQMLHASSYILSMSIAALTEASAKISPQLLSDIMTSLMLHGKVPEPSQAMADSTQRQMREQLRLLEAAATMINQVLKPVTGVHMVERGARPDTLDRKIMMSDAALDSLGIDRDDFDRFFSQYFEG